MADIVTNLFQDRNNYEFAMDATSVRMTPSEIARMLRVAPEKVVGWIRAGELRAVNIATRPTGRPRWVVSQDDLAAFERRRQTVATQNARRTRRPNGLVRHFKEVT